MKKILTLTLILLLVFVVLAGCAGNENDLNEEEPEENADVITTASKVNNEEGFKKAISQDGTWIIITLKDLDFEEELVVEGEFRDKGDPDNDLYRKIAAYAQDEEYNVTERYTITAPKMTIKSPNTKFQGGTFVGDVYVKNNGFTLEDGKIDGNIYFENEEYKSSFDSKNEGEVTGNIEIED